jgi:hypothetical protein
MGEPMTESQLLDAIRLAVGQDPTRCVLWRNNTGVALQGTTRVRYGLCVGSSDLIGIANGRFVALEVKTEQGRVSREQAQFLALVNARGGIGRVVRSVDDALAAVDAAWGTTWSVQS